MTSYIYIYIDINIASRIEMRNAPAEAMQVVPAANWIGREGYVVTWKGVLPTRPPSALVVA